MPRTPPPPMVRVKTLRTARWFRPRRRRFALGQTGAAREADVRFALNVATGTSCSGCPPRRNGALARQAQRPASLVVVTASLAKHWVFVGKSKEVPMRRLLLGSAVALAAAMAAMPAEAQMYGYGYSPYSYGYSPYSYGYSAPRYSYGYSPYSYGYSAPRYSYGYSSYPSYGYSYPSYGYSYPSYSYGYSSYGYRSSNPCLRRHHRNGIVYYTRVC